ncbi:anti-sigma factor [Mameliella sediminis]|uniref:anti-sigma factor n=1 Tax=Mameliella sediminis TaxID=2836866 RepID=UPI001C4715B8|nr:anti-sigma factor [Mameliella sediminis]MBY6116268.1 anti-sigma factor [Antarctobacter heliothermus]MBY6146233.1 anti-sigma factor [Mameliella alba]MBV7397021.1 anti-sigma factor [Mameliella sediminis]MBY6161890.1 anti-sigma factor [Mameliella alba]MBY6170360.1 anti-sigma factor [Mameliella alba]
MNAPLNPDLPGGDEAGAAEYSLGLMPKGEIAEFENRLATDRDLQQDVAAWTEYFASFTDLIPAETPPPQLLRRVETQVFGVTERRSIRKQLLPYLVGAVTGAFVAWAVLASGFLEPQRPALGGDMTGAEDGLSLSMRFDPASAVLTVARTDGAVAEGRVLELWLMPDDGTPVSLALLRGTETLVALPPALAGQIEGGRLMVSEEPLGGAPDGVPTGPQRAEGVLAQQ